MTPSPRRPTGAETKAALREAALVAFRARGYSATGLEEIGRDVGMTRSAVLFHFKSKADLLREIVAPFEVDIDAALDVDLSLAPLTAARRRRLVEGILDCYIRHRDVFRLIAQDITCHEPLDIDGRIAARRARFYQLVAGPAPSVADITVLDAAMGTLTLPLFSPHAEINDETRALIVNSALLVARQVSVGPAVRALN
jgi:AcrR family transcriptional regulator